MYSGKTPFDLAKMPNANALMPMYQQAKARSDRGRIGKGLSYGGGPNGGYNANLVAAVDQQNQDERERDAAGQLEQNVANTFQGVPGAMLAAGQSDQGRRDANWQRYMQMWGTQGGWDQQTAMAKAMQPKWWQTALQGGLGALGSWAGAGFAV
jgi:hypothetical protein